MNDLLLTQLADQFKIVEVVNRFGMAIDLRDWEKLRRFSR